MPLLARNLFICHKFLVYRDNNNTKKSKQVKGEKPLVFVHAPNHLPKILSNFAVIAFGAQWVVLLTQKHTVRCSVLNSGYCLGLVSPVFLCLPRPTPSIQKYAGRWGGYAEFLGSKVCLKGALWWIGVLPRVYLHIRPSVPRNGFESTPINIRLKMDESVYCCQLALLLVSFLVVHLFRPKQRSNEYKI